MKRYLAILLFAAVALFAAKTGSIKGTVKDAESGRPLAGVKVWILDSELNTRTNSRGDFLFKKVPDGTHRLQAEKAGYKPLDAVKVKVQAGKVTTINLKLTKLKDASSALSADKKKTATDLKAADKPALSGSRETAETRDDTPIGLLKSGSSEDAVTEPEAPTEKVRTSGTDETASSLPESITKSGHADPDDATEPRPTKKPESHKFLKLSKVNRPEGVEALTITPSASGSSTRPVPQAAGLKAGFADDNQQFNYFLNFLNRYRDQVTAYDYDISERIQLLFQDAEGKSLPNLEIKIFAKNSQRLVDQGLSFSDGSFFFFPAELAGQDQTFQVNYLYNNVSSTLRLDRQGPRRIVIKTEEARRAMTQVPVDIVFILDTTGSMGEEIKRLLATIDIIHMNLTSLPNLPIVRFGMVLYRDQQDQYVTRVIAPTADIFAFRSELEKVQADGGGDTPEDLQSALEQALLAIDWNRDGLRLGFVITDAAPHLDYGQEFTYIRAATEAKRQGIKLFTVGTGGLNLWGEYILRQISQLTYAKYLFLTYGRETGENEGGLAGSVSHHTGSNYQTDKLESIIIRIAKEEISNFTDNPLEADEAYFQADKVDYETREQTLSKLFRDAIVQMVDYSTLKIENAPKLGVLPVHANTATMGLNAEYFSEQLQLSVAQNKQFTLIARKDLQKILEEQKLQLSGLLTETETIQLGQLLGAEMLLSGELYKKTGGYDLFLKLLRVETAEILAVTKIVLDKDLGL